MPPGDDGGDDPDDERDRADRRLEPASTNGLGAGRAGRPRPVPRRRGGAGRCCDAVAEADRRLRRRAEVVERAGGGCPGWLASWSATRWRATARRRRRRSTSTAAQRRPAASARRPRTSRHDDGAEPERPPCPTPSGRYGTWVWAQNVAATTSGISITVVAAQHRPRRQQHDDPGQQRQVRVPRLGQRGPGRSRRWRAASRAADGGHALPAEPALADPQRRGDRAARWMTTVAASSAHDDEPSRRYVGPAGRS